MTAVTGMEEGTEEGTGEGTEEGTEEGTDEGTEEGTAEGTADSSVSLMGELVRFARRMVFIRLGTMTILINIGVTRLDCSSDSGESL